MRELLLGHRPSPRNWLLFLALGVMLANSFSWGILMLPPAWLISSAVPLLLRTVKLAKNEEMLASGQASRIEMRSYYLYLSQIFLTAVMAAVLVKVNFCLHPSSPLPNLQLVWIYLALAPLCHPLPYRKRIAHWVWLAANGFVCAQIHPLYLLAILVFAGLASLCGRIPAARRDGLLLKLNVFPQPHSDNAYEYRICRLLQRAPYRNLVVGYWAMALTGFYWLFALGEQDPLRVLGPALSCCSLVLLGCMLYKERSARCYELAPTDLKELWLGLGRPIARLNCNYCWSLALGILPLWFLFPQQWQVLAGLTLQLTLVAPISFRLLGPIVFRTGHSRSPVAGFWLSMLAVYFLGLLPGMMVEGFLYLLTH